MALRGHPNLEPSGSSPRLALGFVHRHCPAETAELMCSRESSDAGAVHGNGASIGPYHRVPYGVGLVRWHPRRRVVGTLAIGHVGGEHRIRFGGVDGDIASIWI